MQIRHQYLQRYLHDMAISQLTDEYQSKGYSVSKDEKIGDAEADLVARKAEEVIVVEVKVGKMTPEKRQQITKLGDYVNNQKNHKFFVVFATPPKPKKIQVPNLDGLLYDYILNHFPNELATLSSHTQIEMIEDTTVDELVVLEDGGIQVRGNGTVEVELRYELQKNEDVTYDTFPFTFNALLRQVDGNELTVHTMNELAIDTSSFGK